MTQTQVRLQSAAGADRDSDTSNANLQRREIHRSVELKWQRFASLRITISVAWTSTSPGRKFRVARGFIAQHNFTNRGNHIFTAKLPSPSQPPVELSPD